MEVHIYSSIKAIVATDIVNRYSDDTKRPKLKENQLGILKIYTFCQKIQQKVSGPGESSVWLLIFL